MSSMTITRLQVILVKTTWGHSNLAPSLKESTIWSWQVSNDWLGGKTWEGCNDCNISSNANCKSTFLRTLWWILRQSKTECMVIYQFSVLFAQGDNNTKVVCTHDGVHEKGGCILMSQFKSISWSQDVSEYWDHSHHTVRAWWWLRQ